MSRLKRSSRHYNKAAIRLAALKSIDDKMEMDNGLSVSRYEIAINDLEAKLQKYNTTLSLVDEQLGIVREAEQSLKDLSEAMLIGVANKYGKNSTEYKKAGGVKKSERKRPTRKIRAAS